MNRYVSPSSVWQILQEIQDLGLNRDVERRHRLVADDELRLSAERARDPDPLPLPAGEGVRVAPEVLDVQPDHPHQGLDALLDLLARSALVDPQELPDDLAHRHAWVQRRERVLEDHLDVGPEGRSARPFRRSTRTAWPPPTRNRISPRVGRGARSTRRAVVVFPQPLSPTRPSVSPFATSKLTPSTAATVPTRRRARPASQGWKRGSAS